jgi:hypothetical protein
MASGTTGVHQREIFGTWTKLGVVTSSARAEVSLAILHRAIPSLC